MDLEKMYFDVNEIRCNILGMVHREPEWAANRIQEGEKAIKELAELKYASQVDLTICPNCKHVQDKVLCCHRCGHNWSLG